jgi:tRNA (guanine-N7-)-methyltransferase
MGDALEVLARIPDGALSFVYLLHPDPWPKARHAKRRMMNDGPVDLIAAKLKPGGEFRFGTDHPVYLRWALMVMNGREEFPVALRHGPQDFLKRPGGWPETRYEAKARKYMDTRSGTSVSGDGDPRVFGSKPKEISHFTYAILSGDFLVFPLA